MSGATITPTIKRGYEKAGRKAGNGTGALIVTINRPGAPTGDAWNPTPGAPVAHTFTANPGDAIYARRNGLALGQGVRAYSLVNIGVTITPATSDTLVIDGDNWAVQEVIEMNPAGHVLTWLVRVAR